MVSMVNHRLVIVDDQRDTMMVGVAAQHLGATSIITWRSIFHEFNRLKILQGHIILDCKPHFIWLISALAFCVEEIDPWKIHQWLSNVPSEMVIVPSKDLS